MLLRTSKTAGVAILRTQDGFSIPGLEVAAKRSETGERIYVASNAAGFVAGNVSGYRKLQGEGALMQISAPVSPGSSGGVVLNARGRSCGRCRFDPRRSAKP